MLNKYTLKLSEHKTFYLFSHVASKSSSTKIASKILHDYFDFIAQGNKKVSSAETFSSCLLMLNEHMLKFSECETFCLFSSVASKSSRTKIAWKILHDNFDFTAQGNKKVSSPETFSSWLITHNKYILKFSEYETFYLFSCIASKSSRAKIASKILHDDFDFIAQGNKKVSSPETFSSCLLM